MKKQTAVEWYSEQLAKIGVTEELIGHLTKEAKAMEKEQIIEAYREGCLDELFNETGLDEPVANINAKQYYKETYEKDESKTD